MSGPSVWHRGGRLGNARDLAQVVQPLEAGGGPIRSKYQYVKLLHARLHTVKIQLPLPTLFNSGAQICRDDLRIQCNAMRQAPKL